MAGSSRAEGWWHQAWSQEPPDTQNPKDFEGSFLISETELPQQRGSGICPNSLKGPLYASCKVRQEITVPTMESLYPYGFTWSIPCPYIDMNMPQTNFKNRPFLTRNLRKSRSFFYFSSQKCKSLYPFNWVIQRTQHGFLLFITWRENWLYVWLYLEKGYGCDLNLNILPGRWVVSFTYPPLPHTHTHTRTPTCVAIL